MDVFKIDTRHGTSNTFELSRGNCFPFTGVPFGMNYFAIETNDDNWWFHPEAKHYRGFRITHQPTMWAGTKGDFCSLRILPVGNATIGLTDVAYDPEQSQFHPNQLEIFQKNDQLRTTVIPTDYGCTMNISSSHLQSGIVVSFPTDGVITDMSEDVIEGYSLQLHTHGSVPLKMYFHIRSNHAITNVEEIQPGFTQILFQEAGAVHLGIGTSFISEEYARKNVPVGEDEVLLADVTARWQEKLNKIEVSDHDPKKVQTFYQNMYRAFLYPQRLYEMDEQGNPVHRDMYADQVKPGYLYMNNGFWDTARTVYPLYSLIEVDEYQKILEGFLNSYRESGYLPKWLSPEDSGGMPGNWIDAVIADASIKGIRRDLMPEFLKGMIHSAEVQDPNRSRGRSYCQEYLENQYVPADLNESVNHTLDYSYSDYCISVVADSLNDKTTSSKYGERAFWYQNLFSKNDGFMVARDRAGKFNQNFSPTSWGGDYTEGASWQSTFAVPHDIQGLINLYGGPEKFEKTIVKLGNTTPSYTVEGYGHVIHEMAEMEVNGFGQINVGNQPSFHLPYLYTFIKKSYYAQPLLKQALTRLFNAGWQGYPGDEDNGSMSSWYIFNSLGFYPFCPGSGEYLIGMPIFDHATIHLSNGKSLNVTTESNYPQQQFIDSITVDAQAYRKCFIQHSELIQGMNFTFNLGMVPNPECFNYQEMPFSLTTN